MTEWSVAITIGGRDVPGPVDETVAKVAEELASFAPVISVSSNAATIRVALEAGDASAAVTRSVEKVREALEAVSWRTEVRGVEATEWSLFEARLDDSTYPELVGITEIADLLGTSRQRASELARSSKFPAPLADLAAGPVWPKPVVARFEEEWDRKPGRPRSKTVSRTDHRRPSGSRSGGDP